MAVVEDAFQTLVDQFKDPFAFLRELVQNALDAGSTTIDVKAEIDGLLVTLAVQDTGDGMDRNIIETKLVKLFASSKDGDKTKIGKFGIGFSSVFSIRPEAVVVDTARGAERWRVVFAPDGTWKLFALDEPIEGTCVRVIKRVDNRHEALSLTADARRTLARWCRYADADIRFNGDSIREPFAVECAVSVTVPLEAPGDVVVVGLQGSGQPAWGFYNKGLTLLEGTGALEDLPLWVSFRARDGALEHTITRDNVIRDDAFFAVLERVKDAARGPLLDAALDALEAKDTEPDRRDAIARALSVPLAGGALNKPRARKQRRVLRDARGAGVSLADAAEAIEDGNLARVERAGPLADALEKGGRFVVCAPVGSGVGSLLQALGGPEHAAHEELVALAPVSEKEQWDAAPITRALLTLLEDAGAPVKDVLLARIDDATGALALAPLIAAVDAKLPVERAHIALAAPAAAKARQARAGRRAKTSTVLGLNAAAPPVQDAQKLAVSDPWLAAYLLFQLAHVEGAGDTTRDAKTALLAVRKRCPTPNG